MPDPSGDFLTPCHTPTPLPQQQQHYQPRQQTPVLPARGPGLQYDTNNVPTAPSSPVVLNGPLPPNFIPQTLINSRGVSPPIARSAGLSGMGTYSGMSTPVIPGNPPPVFRTTAPPAGAVRKPVGEESRSGRTVSAQWWRWSILASWMGRCESTVHTTWRQQQCRGG